MGETDTDSNKTLHFPRYSGANYASQKGLNHDVRSLFSFQSCKPRAR